MKTKAVTDRFTKLSREGLALPADHGPAGVTGIRINATGIVVYAGILESGITGKTVAQPTACETANAMGEFIDGHHWRAPQIEELFHIPDRSKFEPALDPVYFQWLIDAYKSEAEGNWRVWSATPDAEYPESLAWYLYLSGGAAARDSQSYQGFAIAVCGPVPSAGQ